MRFSQASNTTTAGWLAHTPMRLRSVEASALATRRQWARVDPMSRIAAAGLVTLSRRIRTFFAVLSLT